MGMYKNDDSNSEEEHTEIPFHRNKCPSNILCFFVAQDNEEVHALVQSCHLSNHEQDSILFQWWSKEYVRRGNIFQPMLHFVPVDSFGCSILVIEDDKSISEMSTIKQLQDGITVIITHKEWLEKFLPCFPLNEI